MYYKITDKSSEVYKKLRDMREKELQVECDNLKKVEELIGFKVGKFIGRLQQNTFDRITQYSGFQFPESITPDSKKWKKSDKFDDAYVPNRRTKAGKELYKSLHSLKSVSSTWKLWECVGTGSVYGKFHFPKLHLSGDIVLFYLDDQQEPKGDGIIEITRTEYLSHLEKNPEPKDFLE